MKRILEHDFFEVKRLLNYLNWVNYNSKELEFLVP